MATDKTFTAADRFLWIQDFAAHLANLGAPGPMRSLLEFGEDEYDAGPNVDPVIAAEIAWASWPTQPMSSWS